MTERMAKDLNKVLKRKIKWLTTAVVILAILLVLVTAFAFSEFDLYIEYDDSQHVEQITDGQTDGEVTQSSEMNRQSDLSTICGAVVCCVIVITIGAVVAYAIARKNKQVNERNAESAERGDK